MKLDNQQALMAVSLAAALAVLSPHGTLAIPAGDEPVAAVSTPPSVALPFDTTTGHHQAPSACASQMQALLMQYGGEGMVLSDLESACAAGQAQPASLPAHQD